MAQTTETVTVEVYQPRGLKQFYDKGADEPADEEMFNLVRDARAGMLESGDIGAETFGRAYDLVGAETVEARSPREALDRVFKSWQNVDYDHDESPVFREMNDQERAVSLSPGHLVRVDGDLHLCESFGWAEVEL